MQGKTLRSIGKLLIPVSIFLMLSACGGNSKPPQTAGKQASALGSDIDVQVLKYLEDNNIPGATVAVTKNGRLVLWKGYGWADKENQVAMQPWHRTRIGSVSKVITAVGALQFVDSGNIALDQPLYSSQITAVWGNAGGTETPWFISASNGALNDIGIHLEALAEAPARLNGPGETLDVSSKPSYLTQGDNRANVEEILDWASRIRVWHAFSHTAGYLQNGNTMSARSYWNLNENDPLSYAQLHAAMLAGASVRNSVRFVPLRFMAGSSRRYSNHGFGLLGMLISEQSGQSYYDYIQDNVFKPLGLTDIVHSSTFTVHDAVSYFYDSGTDQTEPTTPPAPPPGLLGLATGGWAANAYDMARILCGLDTRNSISQPLVPERRLLDSATVKVMNNPDFFPAEINKGSRVLGWDAVKNRQAYEYVTKTGLRNNRDKIPAAARVSKYFYPDLTDVNTEINVAVLFNVNKTPADGLLNDIAEIVEDASIPASYDLFDADYRCVAGPTLVTGS